MQILVLITALLTLYYVIASSALRGLSRFIAPDTAAVAMLVAIFGIRPIFDDRFEAGAWYGVYVPTDPDESVALAVGLLAFLGLFIGIFMMRITPKRHLRLTKQSLKSVSEGINFTAVRVFGFTVGSTLTYIALLTAISGPGILQQLAGGRSSNLAIGGIPEIVMLIPMVGAIASGLFLIANRTRELSRPETQTILLSVAMSVGLLSQLGNRRFIIPAVLIPLSAALIRRPVRVKLWHLVGALIGILFIAIVPMVRAAGARRPGEGLLSAAVRYLREEGFAGVIKPIFVSFDTEMFDYVAVASSTFQDYSYGYGRGTFLEFILRPLPSSLVSGPSWSDSVLTRLFGGGCGQPYCPVASLPGVLYFDGGLVAVFFGAIATGATLRYLTNRWKYNQSQTTLQLLVVIIFSSFALVAVRTNTVHAVWWAIYTLILGLIVYATTVKTARTKAAAKALPRV